HVFPPSSERKSILGSVPTQTTPYPLKDSVLLTATLGMRSDVIPPPALFHVLPLSSLIHNPLLNVPAYIRSGWNGSTARLKKGWGVFLSTIVFSVLSSIRKIAPPATKWSTVMIISSS